MEHDFVKVGSGAALRGLGRLAMSGLKKSPGAVWRGIKAAPRLAWKTAWPILSGYGIYSGGQAAAAGTKDIMEGNVTRGAKRIVGGAGEAAMNAAMLGGTSMLGEASKRIGLTGKLGTIGTKPGAGIASKAIGKATRSAHWLGEQASDMYLWNRAAEMAHPQSAAVSNRFMEPPTHYYTPAIPQGIAMSQNLNSPLNPYK